MQKLKKIDSETNILTWFEIPVLDIKRAKYCTGNFRKGNRSIIKVK